MYAIRSYYDPRQHDEQGRDRGAVERAQQRESSPARGRIRQRQIACRHTRDQDDRRGDTHRQQRAHTPVDVLP